MTNSRSLSSALLVLLVLGTSLCSGVFGWVMPPPFQSRTTSAVVASPTSTCLNMFDWFNPNKSKTRETATTTTSPPAPEPEPAPAPEPEPEVVATTKVEEKVEEKEEAAPAPSVAATATAVETTSPTSSTTAGVVDDRKIHSGRVKWFNPTRGYGFVAPDDESILPDDGIFVHHSAIQTSDDKYYRNLLAREEIEFILDIDEKTGRAKAVHVTGPNGAEVKSIAKQIELDKVGKWRASYTKGKQEE